MNALKRFFSTMRSSARTSSADLERGPELMSLAARGERLHALGTVLRRHHVEIGRPSPQYVLGEGGFDPDHGSAGLAHGARETIDVGHDLFRHRAERVRNAGQHERVLHIDHDQRGFGRVEIVMDVLAATALDDAREDRLRDGQRVHRRLPLVRMERDYPGGAGTGQPCRFPAKASAMKAWASA